MKVAAENIEQLWYSKYWHWKVQFFHFECILILLQNWFRILTMLMKVWHEKLILTISSLLPSFGNSLDNEKSKPGKPNFVFGLTLGCSYGLNKFLTLQNNWLVEMIKFFEALYTSVWFSINTKSEFTYSRLFYIIQKETTCDVWYASL